LAKGNVLFFMEAQNKKILASVTDKPYFSEGNFVLYNADCIKILEQFEFYC